MPYYRHENTQNERPDLSQMPPYRLGRHWNTIQAYLIPGIEDDIGELSEEMKKSVETCELLIDDKMFAKYKWCGNWRPPSSRISLLKAYILKAMRNYPYTKTLIAAVKERNHRPSGAFEAGSPSPTSRTSPSSRGRSRRS